MLVREQERYYLDTSVWNGIKEPAFMRDTEMFFKMIDRRRVICLYSEIVEYEMKGAPSAVKVLFKSECREKVAITGEILKVAETYINRGVVGRTSFDDCVHIAAATVHKADVLVSWNFKHIVNVRRVQGYNSINIEFGYPVLEIRSPKEVVAHGII